MTSRARQPEAKQETPQKGLGTSFEGTKLTYDTYKHLTTLSTGSILLLATFVERLFHKPDWRFLVIVAFLSFVVTVVASVVAMFGSAFAVSVSEVSGNLNTDERREFLRDASLAKLSSVVGYTAFLACGGFLVGVLALALFGAKNFSSH